MAGVPLFQDGLSHSFRDGYAERGVAVQDGDQDLELSDLLVEVSGHEALAKEFDAVHLCLCAASPVISGQLLPECRSKIFAGPQGFVSRDGARCGWFPELRILMRRDDGGGSPGSDHIMASARVIGPIGGDRGNFLIRWDLLQQVRQPGSIADIACRDADRADLQCFFIHPEVKLAPRALFASAMLASVPLTFALSLDPGRINQQMQRPGSTAALDCDAQRLLAAAQSAEVRHFPIQSGKSKQAFDKACRLSKRHAEQYLHRETNLDCRVAELWLPPALAAQNRMPGHLGIKPDR